jgi:heterodisulfide reductase subunit A
LTIGEKDVMVIGGGIAGIQASLDLANRGFTVHLVEKSPTIGGRMAQLDKTFPTMDCSICILSPKMIECARHPKIKLHSYSEVVGLKGSVGDFRVRVLKKPRYVIEEKCVGCGACTAKCPVKVPSEFDMGLGMRKAIYMPFLQSVPRVATIDPNNCLYFTKHVCKVCEKFCQSKAIDYEQKPSEIELAVGAIVVATGFDLFDASVIPSLGYRKYRNVINALELERLLCASGPTNGKLVRPSDGKEPESFAFIQCVGARDNRFGYPYCSSICCKYAVKNAVLIKQHSPDSEVYIFYNDLRVFGKGFQEFANRSKSEYGVKFIQSSPGEIREKPDTTNLEVWYEDTTRGEVSSHEFDMVILSTALVAPKENHNLAKILGIQLDPYGFILARNAVMGIFDTTVEGIYGCGYCIGPRSGDVPDSVMQGSAAAERVAEVLTDLEGGS